MSPSSNRNNVWRNIGEAGTKSEVADAIQPNASRLIDALRQIGYSFEQAVSDLVDNAISADASTILIRFIHDREEIKSLAVVDDGRGMDARELENAMRFGSQRRDSVLSLGKFGMGLKLASLSHAGVLTVATRKVKKAFARRWTLEGIRNDWACDRFSDNDASLLHGSPWSPVLADAVGTVVIWEDIDKLPVSESGLRHTLRVLHRRLDLHLGLHFHRFLENGDLRIFIDQQVLGESEKQIRAEVQPLDPFGYDRSGAKGYPRVFSVDIPDIGSIDIEGHIWPPNSELPEYRLGGRAAARQGFYFYRNNRLIQAGGWNGLMQSETEPHSSLTRVKVDLPPDFDAVFSLNVQKSSVIVPPGFDEAVRVAECSKKTTFDNYRHIAEQVYRSTDERAEKLKPVLPGKGVPKCLYSNMLHARGLEEEDTRFVDFDWAMMNEGTMFKLKRDSGQILLNEYYRHDMLAGLKPEKNDLPLLKLMIYHLLEQDLKKVRTGPAREKELARMNQVLIEAVKLYKG